MCCSMHMSACAPPLGEPAVVATWWDVPHDFLSSDEVFVCLEICASQEARALLALQACGVRPAHGTGFFCDNATFPVSAFDG